MHHASLNERRSSEGDITQHRQERLRIFAPWGYQPARTILEQAWPAIDAVWHRLRAWAKLRPEIAEAVLYFERTAQIYKQGGNHTCISPGSPFIQGYLAQTLEGTMAHLDHKNSGSEWVVIVALYDPQTDAQGGEVWAQDPVTGATVLCSMHQGGVTLLRAGAILHGALPVRGTVEGQGFPGSDPPRTALVLWNPPAVVAHRREHPGHHEFVEQGHAFRAQGTSLVSYTDMQLFSAWPPWKQSPGARFGTSQAKVALKLELAARYSLTEHPEQLPHPNHPQGLTAEGHKT